MQQRTGITVHLRIDRQNSTVDYPEATNARVESNGSLTLNKPGPEYLGSIAKGCWVRWAWTATDVDAQDLDA
jgi:hypothetical protein